MHRPMALLSVFIGNADLSATGHQLTPSSLMLTPSRPNPAVFVLCSYADADASQRRPGRSLHRPTSRRQGLPLRLMVMIIILEIPVVISRHLKRGMDGAKSRGEGCRGVSRIGEPGDVLNCCSNLVRGPSSRGRQPDGELCNWCLSLDLH
jgi:hypothetical protein